MFIELTDHLCCTAEHEESFLVLIPDRLEGRRVVEGTLGCPVCQAEYRISGGIVQLGSPPDWAPSADSSPPGLPLEAVVTLLGLEGPGGYVALGGDGAALTSRIAAILPGVHCVAVNPPAGTCPGPAVSVVHASRWPLKARSMRGVFLAGSLSADRGWRDLAVASVLPGLRAAGTGNPPDAELLATAGGVWVVRRS